jgi:hypothetical protein
MTIDDVLKKLVALNPEAKVKFHTVDGDIARERWFMDIEVIDGICYFRLTTKGPGISF